MSENKVKSRSTHMVNIDTQTASDEVKELMKVSNDLSYCLARDFAKNLIDKCEGHDGVTIIINVCTQSIVRIAVDLLENPFFDDEDREHLLFAMNNEIKLLLNKGKNHV